ncbi:MAG: hypothetical protein BWX50_00621 [Euryarchaeota archaeon ADurb.Bin009]|nr:MAG: hypothetical protein BWX50_00621 [Euryarchaeota archaeon ADurb.Bin009]
MCHGIYNLRSDQVGLEEQFLAGSHLRLHLGDKTGLPVESAQGITDMRVDVVDLPRNFCPGVTVVLIDDLPEQSGNTGIGP